MFGHKLNHNSANKYGQKNTSTNSMYGQKRSHSRHGPQINHDEVDDKPKQSDLERNTTREHHGYHKVHNPMHR
jgi:hypothetical protein